MSFLWNLLEAVTPADFNCYLTVMMAVEVFLPVLLECESIMLFILLNKLSTIG